MYISNVQYQIILYCEYYLKILLGYNDDMTHKDSKS